MSKINYKIIATLIALLLMVGGFSNSFSTSVFAAPNLEINYQGKLTDSSNQTVADGTYQMVFKLYTVASGGTAIWTETRSGANEVQVTSGLFSVMLGEVQSLSGVDFNQTLYLGVTIESDSEMTPRKKLGTVPAAFETDKIDGLDSTDFLRATASSTLSAGNVLTLTGNLDANGNVSFADADIIFDGATTNFSTTGNWSVNTSQLFVDQSTGNVGIGTASPAQKLHVTGGAIRVDNTSAPATFLANRTDGKVLSLAAGLSASTFRFDNSGNFVIQSQPAADIIAGNGSNLIDIATINGSAPANSFYINSSGNVGIGTTGPSSKLTIKGSTAGSNNYSLKTLDSNGTTTFSVSDLSEVGIGIDAVSGISLSLQRNNPKIQFTDTAPMSTSYIAEFGGVLTFSSDINNAVSNSGISFSVDNTQRAFIDSSGNVGINTTGPDRKLDILDASNPQLRLTYTDGTVYTDLQTTSSGYLYMNPSGRRVGIGTASSPESNLHIRAGDGTDYDITASDAQRGVGPTLFLEQTTGSDNNNLAQIVFRPRGSVDTFARIVASGGTDPFLAFGTYDTVVGGKEAFRITQDGNVGIGTTSPGAQLHIDPIASNSEPRLLVGNTYTVNGVAGMNLFTAGAWYEYPGIVGVGSGITNVDIPSLGSYGTVGLVGVGGSNTGGRTHVGVYGYGYLDADLSGNSSNNARGGHFLANITSVVTDFNGSLYGVKSKADSSAGVSTGGKVYGTYSEAVGDTNNTTYGGYFTATGGTTNYGMYSAAGTNYFAENVGIGTTSPSYKLDVVGTGRFTGAFTLDSTLAASGLATFSSGISVNSETITDFTGSGLTLSSGALTVDTSNIDVENLGTSLTAGSVVFSNGTNLAQDNSNFFWDDTNNRLGIGTTSPAATLDVNGNVRWGITANGVLGFSAATSQVRIRAESGNKLTFGSNGIDSQMVIDNGNVGIGTASPQGKLHISNSNLGITPNGNYDDLIIEGAGGSRAGISIFSASTSEGALVFGDSSAPVAGVILYNHVDDYLSFRTNSTDKVRIDSSGNVGIGTTSPASKLHVKDATATYVADFQGLSSSVIRVGDAALAGQSNTEYLNSSGQVWVGIGATGLGTLTSTGGASGLAFSTAGAERLRINNSGNVGIGTASPQSILNLNGGTGSLATGLSFGDGDTGIYETTDDALGVRINGSLAYYTNSTYLQSNTSGAFSIRIPAGSNSFPTYGFIGDTNTGMYSDVADEIGFSLGGSTAMYLKGGNVGIGTETPTSALDVNGTITISGLYKFQNDGRLKVSGGSVLSPSLSFLGDGDTGIWNHTANTLVFSTGGVERGRFDANGNFGIGTSAPLHRLDVDVSNSLTSINKASVIAVQNTNSTTGNMSGILFNQITGASELYGSAIMGVQVDRTPGLRKSDLAFYTLGGGSATPVESMRINNLGNVGIGTTGPDAKLDVLSTSGVQQRLTYTDGSVYTDFTTDSSGYLTISPSGGQVSLGNFAFDTDQTVGAGQDNYVLTYDNTSGLISLEAGAAGLTSSDIDTSAELAAIVTDETGSGSLVFGTSPTITTPTIGTSLTLGSDTISDFTGSGLSLSTGALTVSGLTTSNFASANISQWTNDAGYLTTVTTSDITDDTILEADLDATNAPTDNYVLSYDQATGGFTWVQDVDTDTTLSESQVEGYIFDGDNTGTLSSGTLALSSLSYTGTLSSTYLDSSVILSSEIDTSSEVAGIVGDETGSGALVFGTSPTISSPTISGTLSGASATFSGTLSVTGTSTLATTTISALAINSETFTDLTGTGLTLSSGALSVNESALTLNNIGGTLGVSKGGTGANTLTGLLLGNGTSAVTGLTTSSGVSGALSDETGSGALVFGTSPTFTTNANFFGDTISDFTGKGLALSSNALGFDYSATLAGNPALGASECTFASTGIICEGSSADSNETLLTFTNPTADRTITFQNVTGTVYVSGGTDVAVADGGTGVSSLTAYGLIAGGTSATGAVQSITNGASGTFLKSNGTSALSSWVSITTSDISNLSSWTGSTAITTLGTIGTGTWQGSVISSTYLDTNVILSTEIDTSSELASLITDETGSGALVFGTSPTISGTLSGASATFSGTLGVTGTSTLATTSVSALTLNSETFTDLTGSGLTLSSGALTVDTSNIDVENLGTSLTAGSVVFSNGTNLAQDNSNFFWDDTNNRLGIGTSTPTTALDVVGNVNITGAANGSANVLSVVNTDADTWLGAFGFLAPNMGNGQNHCFSIGKAASTYDRAESCYYHAGDTSTSNRLSFGFYGANNLLNIQAGGKVGIGTTSPAYKLDVWGTGHYTGAVTLDSTLNVTGTSTLGVIDTSFSSGSVLFATTNGVITEDPVVFTYNASTDELYVDGGVTSTTFTAGGDSITDFTGSGLAVSSGALTVSGVTGSMITDSTVGPVDLNGSNVPGVGDCLKYSSSTQFTWGTCGSGGGAFTSAGGYTYLNTSSDAVGIGTSTPEGKMHIYTGSAGSLTANAAADELVLEGSGATGLSILAGNNNFANIYFGGSFGGNLGASISYFDDGSDFMTIDSGATTLSLNGFGGEITSNSNFRITGSNKYLNFGSTSGTSGYGFRDNSGSIEFKNSGGSWLDIASLDATSQSFTGINTFSRSGSGTSDYTFAVTGTPVSDSSSSLIRIGNALSGGNGGGIGGGTYIGLNAPSSGPGTTADLIHLQRAGATRFKVTSAGDTTIAGSTTIGGASDFTTISSTGDLSFTGGGDYLVGANDYAFRYSGDEDAGLYFSSTNSAFEFSTVTGTVGLRISAANGDVFMPALSTGAGTGAICADSSTGELLYRNNASCTGSSLRYKHDIETSSLGLSAVRSLRPVSFVYNEDYMPGNVEMLGFIAEEVAEIDGRFAVYDEEGRPDGIRTDSLLSAAVGAIQELDNSVSGVNSDLTDLHERLDIVETKSVGVAIPLFNGFFDRVLNKLDAVLENGRVVFNRFFTKEFAVVVEDKVEANDPDESAVGSGVIESGQREVVVNNRLINEHSKIFVTFTTPLDGITWHVSEKRDGAFTISLSDAANQEISFDYFTISVIKPEMVEGDSGVEKYGDSNFNVLSPHTTEPTGDQTAPQGGGPDGLQGEGQQPEGEQEAPPVNDDPQTTEDEPDLEPVIPEQNPEPPEPVVPAENPEPIES